MLSHGPWVPPFCAAPDSSSLPNRPKLEPSLGPCRNDGPREWQVPQQRWELAIEAFWGLQWFPEPLGPLARVL